MSADVRFFLRIVITPDMFAACRLDRKLLPEPLADPLGTIRAGI